MEWRKVLTSVVGDCHKVIPIDFLNKGRSINGNYHSKLLATLLEKIKERRRGKLLTSAGQTFKTEKHSLFRVRITRTLPFSPA